MDNANILHHMIELNNPTASIDHMAIYPVPRIVVDNNITDATADIKNTFCALTL